MPESWYSSLYASLQFFGVLSLASHACLSEVASLALAHAHSLWLPTPLGPARAPLHVSGLVQVELLCTFTQALLGRCLHVLYSVSTLLMVNNLQIHCAASLYL